MQAAVRKQIIGVVSTVLLLAATFGVLVWHFLLVEELTTEHVADYSALRASNVWFPDEQQLVAYGVAGGKLRIWRLSTAAGSQPEVRELETGNTTPELVAVSRKGTMAAWMDGQKLYVADTVPTSNDRPSLRRTDALEPAAGLAFTGQDTLAVLHSSGELRLVDPRTMAGGWSLKLEVSEPDMLRAAGRYIAAASRKSREAAVIAASDSRSASLIEIRTFPKPFERLVVSPSGRLVALTANGTTEGVHEVLVPPRTCCVDFRDEETYVAAGDFPGIYHLRQGEKPKQMSATRPGVVAMAATGTWVALGYKDRLELRTYRRYMAWRPVPPEFWKSIAIMSMVALLILLKVFKKSWGAILLSMLPIPPVGPVLKHARKPEKPLPDVSGDQREMQDALANRECVLVTGEDLSRQIGMPVWRIYLRGLVDYMADQRVLNPEHADKLRAGLNTGQYVAVQDALRATLGADERPALEYAQRLYSKAAPLTRTYEALLYLPFSAALTTNLDRLTERVMQAGPDEVFVPEEAEQVVAKVADRARFVLKLRGSFDRPGTVLVWPDAAAESAGATPGFAVLMRQLLTNRNLLFIGMPLEDVLRWVSIAGEGVPVTRRHIAVVMQVNSKWKNTARLLKAYNIEVMAHSPEEPDVLINFLTKLAASNVEAAAK